MTILENKIPYMKPKNIKRRNLKMYKKLKQDSRDFNITDIEDCKAVLY